MASPTRSCMSRTSVADAAAISCATAAQPSFGGGVSGSPDAGNRPWGRSWRAPFEKGKSRAFGQTEAAAAVERAEGASAGPASASHGAKLVSPRAQRAKAKRPDASTSGAPNPAEAPRPSAAIRANSAVSRPYRAASCPLLIAGLRDRTGKKFARPKVERDAGGRIVDRLVNRRLCAASCILDLRARAGLGDGMAECAESTGRHSRVPGRIPGKPGRADKRASCAQRNSARSSGCFPRAIR